MLRHLRVIITFCLSATLLTACNHTPDHMRYIPKDAVVVAGVNLKALGKKIAWNMITGSKLFKEMQARMPQNGSNDAISGIDKAGIDGMNTFYVYLKTGKSAAGQNKVVITALVPLSDAAKWEDYLKKNFPQTAIQQHSDIKELAMSGNMYAGWNKNTLIVVNVINNVNDYSAGLPLTTSSGAEAAAEMDSAFAVAKGSNIGTDANFMKLQNADHDVTLWMNYGQMMSQYMQDNMASKMGGLSLNTDLWKNAAFACGFDFKKGKITGDMAYYTPAEYASVYKEFGTANADKDMLDRLPASDMNMLLAMHISPKGIKSILEKTGYLGLANAGLQSQNTSVDNLLSAFTGDIALTVNHLSITNADVLPGIQGQKTQMSASLVIKINNKDEFSKLFQMAQLAGMQPVPDGYFMPISDRDSVFLLMNGQYAVAANKFADAMAILNGSNKGQKMTDAATSQVPGHPFALFLDVAQSVKNIDFSGMMTPADSAIVGESKRLISNVSMNGGEFKDNAMVSHMEINFTNTEENSIITLLDFGMRMTEAANKQQAQPAL